MKKLILVLFLMAGFMACVDESIEELPQDTSLIEDSNQLATSTEDLNARLSPKINICHKGDIINVSVNSIDAHQGHGDAIDMDGDGYFDIDNECSETDLDDNDPTVNICDVTITEIRLGGQEGDAYIGPVCNPNESYRTCFYVAASEIPETNEFYKLSLNGIEYPIAFQSFDGDYLVLCATGLPLNEVGVDVLIQLTECGSSEVIDLYDAPSCNGSSARLSGEITEDSFKK